MSAATAAETEARDLVRDLAADLGTIDVEQYVADEPGATDEAPATETAAAPAVDPSAKLLAQQKKIQNGAIHVQQLRAQWKDAAEFAKEAKKNWEVAADSHIRMCAAMDEDRPLYGKFEGNGEASDAAPAPAKAAPEEWRGVPLSTLEISEHTLELLEQNEPPIRTVGDLADWTKGEPGGHGRDLEKIRGIGATKAKAIDEALTDFWAGRRSRGLDGSEGSTPDPDLVDDDEGDDDE